MDSYNFWQDLFDTYQSLSDWMKTLWLIVPPAFALGALWIGRLAKVRQQLDVTWDLEDLDTARIIERLPGEFSRFKPNPSGSNSSSSKTAPKPVVSASMQSPESGASPTGCPTRSNRIVTHLTD